MSKLLHSKLFLLLIVGISFISGVLASNYMASDVLYTPSDTNWNVSNVKAALDDLYSNRKTFDFEELYTASPGYPTNFSYTFT